jgi:cytochrome c peroxidase
MFFRLSLLICAFAFITSFLSEPEPTPYKFPSLLFFPEMPKNPDNPVTIEGIELGRRLFYDSILSGDYNLSCASCHKQEYAFSDGGIKFSKGHNNKSQKRNTMPLFNLAWYESFFWDGHAQSIEEQALFPVRSHDELNLNWSTAKNRIQENTAYRNQFRKAFGNADIDSTTITKAIAQFERSLISYNSRYDQAIRREIVLTKDEYDGFVLMNDQTKGNCLHCHPTDPQALATTGKFSNNGLENQINLEKSEDRGKYEFTKKEVDMGLFKIPSLRNIALTGPYMHDGRFETLDEVLDFYSENIQESNTRDSRMGPHGFGGFHFSAEEKRKIICFLHALTDSTFISNPAHSNPN